MPADANKHAVLVVGTNPLKAQPLAERVYSTPDFGKVDGVEPGTDPILVGAAPDAAAGEDKRRLGTLASAAARGDRAAIQSLAEKLNFVVLVAAGDDEAMAFDRQGDRRVELGPVNDFDHVIAGLRAFVSTPRVEPVVLDLSNDVLPPAKAGAIPGKQPELDLAQRDELVSAEPAIVELQSIQVRREQVRGAIAVLLILALIATIFIFLIGDMLDRPVDGNKLNLCITALVSLVGAAMGFYFGTEAKK